MAICWPLHMPPTAKAVLISLADNANDQGYCWPSIPTIANRTCFSERAVQGAIKWLEQNGALIADRSNGRHTTYQVTAKSYIQPPQEVRRLDDETPAGDSPPQDMHPAANAPTPAGAAPLPPQEVRQPPQEVPSNRKEPSLEPSLNRQSGSRKKVEYSHDFELAWSRYPQRPGASKPDAWKAWKAQLEAGASSIDIIAGVERYAAYVVAKGTEPDFIKQPKTFFGPGEHYKSDWTIQARASPRAGHQKFDPVAHVNRNRNEPNEQPFTLDAATGKPV